MGWGGLTNGALLEKAELEFDVFLTGDRNLSFQQEVSKFNIAVLVLHADSTQLHDTLLLMPKVLTLLPTLQSGQVVSVCLSDIGAPACLFSRGRFPYRGLVSRMNPII